MPAPTKILFFLSIFTAPFVGSQAVHAACKAGPVISDFLIQLFKPAEEPDLLKEMAKYQPIVAPTEIKASMIAQVEAAQHQKLQLLGVGIKDTGYQSVLKFEQGLPGPQKIIRDLKTPLDFGKVYEVTQLPPGTGKASPFTPAFIHPEMAKYKEWLEEMGYRLAVDDTMSLTGTGAYFQGENGIVALNANSPWNHFRHEFQHAQFNRYFKLGFENAKAAVEQGKRLRELVSAESLKAMNIPVQNLDRLEAMLKKGFTENSIDETLAVDAQLKVLKWRRYLPFVGSEYIKYALRHQITDFLEMKLRGEVLTAVQARALDAAKAKYRLILYRDLGLLTGIVGVPAALASQSKAVYRTLENWIDHPEQDPASYKNVLIDQDYRVLGQKNDGTWVILNPGPAPKERQE